MGCTKLHTHTHTPGRTTLNKLKARRRARYLQQTQGTNIHTLTGIRNHDPSDQAAADLRLRPHGHRDRRIVVSAKEFSRKAQVLYCVKTMAQLLDSSKLYGKKRIGYKVCTTFPSL